MSPSSLSRSLEDSASLPPARGSVSSSLVECVVAAAAGGESRVSCRPRLNVSIGNSRATAVAMIQKQVKMMMGIETDISANTLTM